MKAVILGATKGMGRALSRLMAERGDSLFLLGVPEKDLKRSAADLEIRGGTGQKVGWAVCDLAQPDSFAPALQQAEKQLGGIDTVIQTAAIFATQDELEGDTEKAEHLLRLNFTNTVVFCERARKLLTAQGGGTLCVFSSVAGDRGRKPVGIYGATKAGLSHYLETLDHRYRADGLKTVCVKPGFVKTSMTDGLDPPPFAGEPEQVAKRVLGAIDRGTPVIYAPAPWRAVMAIIKRLPRFVMRRINF